MRNPVMIYIKCSNAENDIYSNTYSYILIYDTNI